MSNVKNAAMTIGTIIFTLVVFAVGFFIGVVANGHASRPELTNDELFDAIDRIVKVCDGDYGRVRVMLDELYKFMTGEMYLIDVSDELNEIIEGVRK